MPTGSTRSVGGPGGGVSTVTVGAVLPADRDGVPRETLRSQATTERISDVQEPNILRVTGDKGSARLDVLAHEHTEQLVRGRGVVESDLQQDPLVRVHGRVPQ